MISARNSIVYFIVLLLLQQSSLMAAVVIEKRVNSWTQEGYVIVVGVIMMAFALCFGCAFYERQRKK